MLSNYRWLIAFFRPTTDILICCWVGEQRKSGIR